MSTERKPVAFNKFGGLRLDLPLDEIGGEQAQYLRDVDWDGNTGRLRARDGFAKLKAADATGPYKGLFAHSATRLLAVKRVKSSEVKIVAIDKEGAEKTSATWPEGEVTSCFTRFGTPSASYTYCRANLTTAKVVRFDGTEFTEPTCSVDGVTGKEMPRGKIMLAWPDGGDRLITLNTGATGGPGGAASSDSHGWFSEAEGKAEAYESTAYVQFGAGDGEEITDGQVFGGQVFVFKETKFFVIYGISTDEEGRPIFEVREVSLGEGSRMKRPVVTALAESSDRLSCVSAEGVYFCTSAGVFLTTGSTPTKISQALRPLEEVSPFDGPMAEFLNGETEVFRWPATGIACLGTRLIVRRYEFMFILDIPTGQWTCWRMTAVSMAIWTGLTGGGSESTGEKTAGTAASSGSPAWSNPDNAKVKDGSYAVATIPANGPSGALTLTNFSPDVPEGATVVGFGVTLWGKASLPGQGGIESVELIREGTASASIGNVPSLVGVADAQYVLGGAEALGGLSWTAAQANASTSGVRIVGRSNWPLPLSVEIDAVLITAYYFTHLDAASGVRPRLFCTEGKSVFVTKPGADDDAGTRDAEWQSGFYDLGSEDEKDLVGLRAFGSGTVDAVGYSDFDESPSVSGAHLEFPTSGNRSVLDQNGLTDSGVMFSHKLKLEPGSRIQRLARYLQETRAPTTKSR